MAPMTDDDLLKYLEAEQSESFQYNDGEIASARQKAMRDYLRFPYGTEQEGRSQVIASDVFDAVEGMLPDIVEVFVASDKAVVFDPVGPEDEEGAKQATNACNHVFYKQNNGFLILYTAAKDALMLRVGGVKWWWDVRRTPSFTTRRNVPEMQLALYLTSNPDAEVLEMTESEPQEGQEQQVDEMGNPMQGPRTFDVKIKTVEEKGQVRVAAIPADELEVSARHNSILLDDCPFVCHKSLKTLSDITQMGFDVTVDDVKAAKDDNVSTDREFYDTLRGVDARNPNVTDESMERGWLREEYILIDFDGDGIAERRKVIRLGKKILENVEFSHVPISAWTPYLLTHKFDGMSVHDLVEDFQRAGTDIWRNQIDNLALANNQETVVLTDAQGNPKANIDDLLNRRVGGVLREQVAGAIRPYTERWQGIEAMPLLNQMRMAKEARTGYAPAIPGLDADSLNKTAMEVSKTANERQKRAKLMARMMAEALVKPMFRGIFKTLTDYCMEKLSFRLNGSFESYDPQEWRDGYDMSINVGIGTGDTREQTQFLQGIAAAQMAIAQSPFGQLLVDAGKIYAVHTRLAELAGFKNPGEFWNDPTDPQTGQLKQLPPPGKPPEVMLKEMELQADAQKFQAMSQNEQMKFQAESELKQRESQMQLELQASNDARDSERETLKAGYEAQLAAQQLELDRYKTDADNQTRIYIAQLTQQAALQKQEMANESADKHAVFNAEQAQQAMQNEAKE